MRVGIDLVEMDRMAAALERTPGLVTRLFTPDERVYCSNRYRPVEHFAARFAAKEAAMKALGVGIGSVGWHDIEVRNEPGGAPCLVVTGRAAALSADGAWSVSLTHTAHTAGAVVLLACGDRRMDR